MQNDCIGSAANGATAPGYPAAALKTPTGYTGIYEAWSISLTPGDNPLQSLEPRRSHRLPHALLPRRPPNRHNRHSPLAATPLHPAGAGETL